MTNEELDRIDALAPKDWYNYDVGGPEEQQELAKSKHALVAAVRERDAEIARLRGLVRDALDEGASYSDSYVDVTPREVVWQESDVRKSLDGVV